MRDPLAVYLQDHFAGAMFGVQLVTRCRRNNEGTEFGEELSRLVREIETDREILRRLMGSLGAPPSRLKTSGAWASEKLHRLKLNGPMRGYSPLARLEELESLAIGIAGKRSLWSALEHLRPPPAGYDFAALRGAAEDQLERVEALRLRAAEVAFASSSREPAGSRR